MGSELLHISTEHYIRVIREEELMTSARNPLLNVIILFIP